MLLYRCSDWKQDWAIMFQQNPAASAPDFYFMLASSLPLPTCSSTATKHSQGWWSKTHLELLLCHLKVIDRYLWRECFHVFTLRKHQPAREHRALSSSLRKSGPCLCRSSWKVPSETHSTFHMDMLGSIAALWVHGLRVYSQFLQLSPLGP